MQPCKIMLEANTWGRGNKRRSWSKLKNFSVDQSMVIHTTQSFPNTRTPVTLWNDSLCISMLWFTYSTFTANSVSLLLTNKTSVFLFIVCKFFPNKLTFSAYTKWCCSPFNSIPHGLLVTQWFTKIKLREKITENILTA